MNSNPDNAVSEVLGTLLLVALVVILATFIGAAVYAFIGPSMATKNVALTASPGFLNATSPTTLITIHGGQHLDQLTILEYSLDNSGAWGRVTDLAGNELATGTDYPLQVGQVVFTSTNSPNGKRLMLRGTFSDGIMQILYTNQF